MNADTEFSGRIIEIDYGRSVLLVRYEGAPPEIGATVIPTGLPVAYQHHYPDGNWRTNGGEPINGLQPDQSRPLYAPLTPTFDPLKAVALDIARWFINGDRPDEFKLKEWAERLDREAISKAYQDRNP